MAFHIANWGSIAGFEGPIPVSYWLSGDRLPNPMPLFAEAVPQSAGASLVNNGHTVELAGGQYTHYVWVRNETGTPTSYTLSGGRPSIGFSVPNYGSIGPFEGPIFVSYTYRPSGGSVPGPPRGSVFFAIASPQAEGCSLVITDHTVEVSGGPLPKRELTHYFWVRNETAVPTSFTLVGGQLS